MRRNRRDPEVSKKRACFYITAIVVVLALLGAGIFLSFYFNEMELENSNATVAPVTPLFPVDIDTKEFRKHGEAKVQIIEVSQGNVEESGSGGDEIKEGSGEISPVQNKKQKSVKNMKLFDDEDYDEEF